MKFRKIRENFAKYAILSPQLNLEEENSNHTIKGMNKYVTRGVGNQQLPQGRFTATQFYDQNNGILQPRTVSKEEREAIEEKLKKPLDFDKVSLKPGFGRSGKVCYDFVEKQTPVSTQHA